MKNGQVFCQFSFYVSDILIKYNFKQKIKKPQNKKNCQFFFPLLNSQDNKFCKTSSQREIISWSVNVN